MGHIIEYVTAYKNILTVKQEYEAFIARIKNGQRSAYFLHGRLKLWNLSPQLYCTIGKEQGSLKTTCSSFVSCKCYFCLGKIGQDCHPARSPLSDHEKENRMSGSVLLSCRLGLNHNKVTEHTSNAGFFYYLVFFQLTFSEAVGDIIYDYGKVEPSDKSKCLALAEVVYGQSGAHKKVALCLCEQHQISGAMGYIQQLEHFSSGWSV
ncbi:LOW QUALITY PROTEIN: clathrin heavy chain linker domain-containing protein 1 [Morphnus guianensis]